MNALDDRQFDLYDVSTAEWQAMSLRQRAELIKHQNDNAQMDHNFGPTYFASQELCDAIDSAHVLYVKMSPEQRRTVAHPRNLDQWLNDRRIVTIVARDLDLDAPMPEELRPESYRISDDGPQPVRATRLNLTVAISLDAPLKSVIDAVRDLITGLHGPAARRPRRAGAVRRDREKYDDDEIAKMIDWYYRHAAGEPLKQLAIASAGPTAEHVKAMQSKILRQMRWLRRDLGIA
jgi:hypothetical protein